ncbi:glycoside hydrolase family 5 protein [Natrinema salaciae]|uniref:Cellulase (Glycosyl hydrolase family 5) n=1 Tax=Natrinema salaciae TaxID=1186196 RepID=A0A1H9IGZ6_9EURY|nr:cellulase family glycosylhydrolase [Natrinema salaciae]SEQ73665.1 Cellulase (glycosyl hydrolase family 5) [Natrinema salaciae]
MVRKDNFSEKRRTARTNAGSLRPTRRTFVKAAGVGTAGLALGGLAGSAAAVDNPTPRLHTDGKWIVTEDGERVKLRGLSPASLDYMQEGYYPRTQREVLEHATDGEQWYPNTVRLPIVENAVHEQGPAYVVDELLRPAVDLLADRGVYAMIDFHLIRPYVDVLNQAEEMVEDGWADSLDGLGFDPWVGTDELLREFWGAVAPAFADDENVLFELYNEPTLPVAWSEYGEYGPEVGTKEDEWMLWRDTAQSWVDLIREEAPETPIVIGSPDWTSRTKFAAEYPFDGENLIYAGHIYPDNGLPYDTLERGEGDDAYEVGPFDPEYGAPAEDVPVVCTEFGWDPAEEFRESVEFGTTSEWGEPVREWMESYENMGWIAWCFDDTWAPTFFDSPGDGAGEPWELKDDPEQMGWFVRQWLEETKDDMIVGEDGDENGSDWIGIGDYEARDTTGDGLYNDVDGDGQTTHADVDAFYEHLESDGVQNNPDAFDFDENGRVGFADVLDLLRRI